jgi:hypothetical protein
MFGGPNCHFLAVMQLAQSLWIELGNQVLSSDDGFRICPPDGFGEANVRSVKAGA